VSAVRTEIVVPANSQEPVFLWAAEGGLVVRARNLVAFVEEESGRVRWIRDSPGEQMAFVPDPPGPSGDLLFRWNGGLAVSPSSRNVGRRAARSFVTLPDGDVSSWVPRICRDLGDRTARCWPQRRSSRPSWTASWPMTASWRCESSTHRGVRFRTPEARCPEDESPCLYVFESSRVPRTPVSSPPLSGLASRERRRRLVHLRRRCRPRAALQRVTASRH
jgi:hypothetical protein